MAHYTTFHFRAKLNFNLPESVATTLQNQCGPQALAMPLTGADDDWYGWQAHPHEFFSLPNAGYIPRGDAAAGDFPAPDFRRYADGGAQLIFTCEFKNYADEIQRFLDWIAPYVRGRFGKRSRGRRLIWVGWMRPECADRAYNIFIAPSDWTSGDGATPLVFIR